MTCANHPSVESVAFCGQCGRPLCGECKHEVRGMVYCENCLAARLQGPGLPPLYGPTGGPNPGVALALGFIPGVGAIYNGQVVKAIVQVLIFASLIAIGDRTESMGPLFGIGAAAFYFYMVIDSYQTAKRKQLGQPSEEWFGLGELKMNVPIGAALLIGLGALILLDNLGIPVFRHVGKFWPALLILVGLFMLQRRMSKGGGAPPPGSEPPGPPKEGSSNYPGPLGL
jgi:TM2 domain-containing membrane protein YozV